MVDLVSDPAELQAALKRSRTALSAPVKKRPPRLLAAAAVLLAEARPAKPDPRHGTPRAATVVGHQDIPSVPAGQGLNSPCRCGSGKKFKRCCARRAA